MKITDVTVILEESENPFESMTFRIWLPLEMLGIAILTLAKLPMAVVEANEASFSLST
jgi:hypothetical protein